MTDRDEHEDASQGEGGIGGWGVHADSQEPWSGLREGSAPAEPPDPALPPPEPAPRRRRRRPSSLRTSAVDSSAAALGERVTSSAGTVSESEPTSSIINSPPVIGWMRAAGLAPPVEEGSAPEPPAPPAPEPAPIPEAAPIVPEAAPIVSEAAPVGPEAAPIVPEAAPVIPVAAPIPEAAPAPAPAWAPTSTALPTPEPAPVPSFVKAAQEAAAVAEPPATEIEEPVQTDATPEPEWIDAPVVLGAEPPLSSDVPAVEPSRIDRTFDKFSEMATNSVKKFADNLTKRAGGSEATDSEPGAANGAAAGKSLPAPVGEIAKVVRDRPELGVIATFAGGLILATLLKRLARR